MMEKLLRLKEVLVLIGLKKTALYDMIDAGAFPKPIKLWQDGRAVAWVESEIQEWIRARINERDNRNM